VEECQRAVLEKARFSERTSAISAKSTCPVSGLYVQVKLHWLILVPTFAKELLVVLSSFRPRLAILAAALLMTSVAFAFNAPLSDEAVREAYFLGQRHDDRTAQFLETYRRYFPVPKSGPHVFAVELFTPYAQAVEASSKHSVGYSSQQAWQDYKARGDSVRVGVYVRYTSTYGPGFPYSSNKVPGQTGTWKDFQVRLTVNGKTLESRSVRYEGTRMGTGGGKSGGGSRPTGFIVWQEYDAFNPNSTDATVEIDTPDGQHVVVSFDLSRLR
jgi:hypothetical protein